jgi:hypothetical protein
MKKKLKLNSSPEELLGRCPDGGRHFALLGAATKLKFGHLCQEEARNILGEWLTRKARRHEIEEAVAKAYGEVSSLETAKPRANCRRGSLNWPMPDPEAVRKVFGCYGGFDALWKWLDQDPPKLTCGDWLEKMFRLDDLVCIGVERWSTQVKSLWEWLSNLPVEACLAPPSTFWTGQQRRSNSNVKDRRYFVLDLDIAASRGCRETMWVRLLNELKVDHLDLQSAVVRYLFELRLPICTIVHSGNTSFQVWCSARRFTADELRSIYQSLCPFGVDRAGFTPSQFMRVVNEEHPTRQQTLIYFDEAEVNR